MCSCSVVVFGSGPTRLMCRGLTESYGVSLLFSMLAPVTWFYNASIFLEHMRPIILSMSDSICLSKAKMSIVIIKSVQYLKSQWFWECSLQKWIFLQLVSFCFNVGTCVYEYHLLSNNMAPILQEQCALVFHLLWVHFLPNNYRYVKVCVLFLQHTYFRWIFICYMVRSLSLFCGESIVKFFCLIVILKWYFK